MYRSIYHLQDIPEAFRNFMFGTRNVKQYYDSKNVLEPVSRSTLTPEMALAPIRRNSNIMRNMLANDVDLEIFFVTYKSAFMTSIVQCITLTSSAWYNH